MNRNELKHWGILGMRWGIRRSNTSSSSNSADHIRAQTLKKKKLSQMSNEEIRALTTRMQLEKQVKDLRSQDISKGKKIVKSILSSDIGKKVASAFITSLIKSALRKAQAATRGATGTATEDVIDGLLLESSN